MIEVNNLSKSKIDRKFLITVVKNVLKGENIKRGELSVALVGSKKIKELNKKYRRKNQPTDVLSFEHNLRATFQGVRSASSIIHNSKFSYELGEIVICPSQVKRNAKKYKTSFKKELTRVLIHGILHLIGYGHERSKKEAKKMERKQQYYLSQI